MFIIFPHHSKNINYTLFVLKLFLLLSTLPYFSGFFSFCLLFCILSFLLEAFLMLDDPCLSVHNFKWEFKFPMGLEAVRAETEFVNGWASLYGIWWQPRLFFRYPQMSTYIFFFGLVTPPSLVTLATQPLWITEITKGRPSVASSLRK